MADDEFEDLIDVGSERGGLLGAGRRHPWARAAAVLALLGLVVAAIVTQQRDGGTGNRPAGRTAAPAVSGASGSGAGASGSNASGSDASGSDASGSTGSASDVPVSPVVDDSYLYAVPPQDLRAELGTRVCRSGCVTATLSGPRLLRATAAFPGSYPLTGGIVTRHGAVIFQSIEARAVPDALVHLVLRRVGPHPATAARVSERAAGPSRTITVRQERGGWQLTAEIVVRGTEPPSAAALSWSATTRLPQ